MTATTISQQEGEPYEWPDTPDGLSTEAAAIDAALVWGRIESHVCTRYSERGVTWVVEGPGDWQPPLKPAEIATVEEWRGASWVETTLDASPLGGFILKGCGPYRFTGTVGEDGAAVPALVVEAFKRLAEFMAATSNMHGAGLRSESIPDIWQGEFDQRARARALQDSGAADLLRNYRRA